MEEPVSGRHRLNSGNNFVRPEELLARGCRGDEASFVALLDMFEQPIYAYFRRRRLPSEAAEELAHQVFVSLLEQHERFDARRGRLRQFLFGIARRIWLKHVAALSKAPGELSPSSVHAEVQQPDRAAEDKEQVDLIKRAIENLPPALREPFDLRLTCELSVAEIAEMLQMPTGTVKTHLHRARALIRHQLG